ncbi:MAG: (2Fe-2S)-binding protein [Bacteroidales bacterium]|nr:(2Fe-2S)-binding protein [Bacteroidales bacterium]MBN2632086.1 (2Fe-2S)-binding protein [Bacteroidales bacterium]
MYIKINNIEFHASEGETVLDVARRAGISIPTLCHKDGVEHYSSCMVCLVRDRRNNSYIPSCSALVQEGMDIDASGDDVKELRRKAVELLLLEHRAECEAPCRVVCPAAYDIPRMNRLLSAGRFREAVDLIVSELATPEIRCLTCGAYCENACRRKKIDTPISIRNIRLFIFDKIKEEKLFSGSAAGSDARYSAKEELKNRFSSRTGKLNDAELRQWLKECDGMSERYRDITSFEQASSEAESCMHCDCRAAGNCALRAVAEDLSLKDPAGKLVNSPIKKKINKNTGLIFENAKCIKCGLCVRVCEDSNDEPALCFINRGFVSIISEPLTAEFDDILASQARKAVEVCPTGALSFIEKT